MGAAAVLRRNLLIYGVVGSDRSFAGIKVIDLIIAAWGCTKCCDATLDRSARHGMSDHLLGGVFPLRCGESANHFHHQANGPWSRSTQGRGFFPHRPELTDQRRNRYPSYFHPAVGRRQGLRPTSSSGSNLGPSNSNLVGNNIDDPQNNPYRRQATLLRSCTGPMTKAMRRPMPKATRYTHRTVTAPYVCNPNTVPERVLAYRQFNDWPQESQCLSMPDHIGIGARP